MSKFPIHFQLTACLHVHLQKHLAKEQNMLRMNNIFGSPHREKVLVSLLKRQCSSVRNAFRQDVRYLATHETNS